MNEILVSYLVQAMLVWSPAIDHNYYHETPDHVEARYYSIATDLVKVLDEEGSLDVFDNEQDDVAFAHTALLMLGVASFESGGFRMSVDEMKASGDSGHSKCLMQVWLRPGESIKNRQDCFRLGLARIRESFDACPNLPLDDRLAVYASGHCDVGLGESKRRMSRVSNRWERAPFFGHFTNEEN
jgi:hypothetical protein